MTGKGGEAAARATDVWGPAKSPREIVCPLYTDIVKAMQAPEFRSRLDREGASDPIGNTPEQMAATIRSDIDRLGKLIRAAWVKLQ